MPSYYIGKTTGAITASDTHTKAQATNPLTPWATFKRAAGLTGTDGGAEAGATIKIQPGVYHEILRITKPGQHWTAADPDDMPIIDGYYGPHLWQSGATYKLPLPWLNNGWLPVAPASATFIGAGLIDVNNQPDTTISYLHCCNSAGSHINGGGMGCHNLHIHHCKLDFSYAGAIMTGSKVRPGAPNRLKGLIIEHNEVSRSSYKNFTNTGPSSGHEQVGNDPNDVTIKPSGTDGAIVRYNTVAFCGGEGIAAASGSIGTQIYGNRILNTGHWSLGLNNAWDADIHDNLIINDGDPDDPHGTASAGILIGDEVETWEAVGMTTKGFRIYNNIIVGNSRQGIEVRGTGNYVTCCEDGYIGHNTVVSYSLANTPIKIAGGQIATKVNGQWVFSRRGHKSLLVEGNAFITISPTNPSGILGNDPIGNVVFRANAFNTPPDPGMAPAGSDTLIGAAVASALKRIDLAPVVPFVINAPACHPTSNVDPAHYQIQRGSALIGAGPAHTAAAGVSPAVSPTAHTRDFFGNARHDHLDGRYDIGAAEYNDPEPPAVTAAFTVDAPPDYRRTTTFINTSHYTNAAETAVTWLVTRPDGTTESANAQTIAVTFDAEGTWRVRLTATGAPSCSDSTEQTYAIVNPEPPTVPSFAQTANGEKAASGTAPYTVTFTDATTGTPPTAWHWSMGDGTTYDATDGASINHTYTEPGVYTPTLTVDTPAGPITASGKPISVDPPPPPQLPRLYIVMPDGTTGEVTLTWLPTPPPDLLNHQTTPPGEPNERPRQLP